MAKYGQLQKRGFEYGLATVIILILRSRLLYFAIHVILQLHNVVANGFVYSMWSKYINVFANSNCNHICKGLNP